MITYQGNTDILSDCWIWWQHAQPVARYCGILASSDSCSCSMLSPAAAAAHSLHIDLSWLQLSCGCCILASSDSCSCTKLSASSCSCSCIMPEGSFHWIWYCQIIGSDTIVSDIVISDSLNLTSWHAVIGNRGAMGWVGLCHLTEFATSTAKLGLRRVPCP